MIVREGITRLVQQLYVQDTDEMTWLEGIRRAADDAFEGCVHIQAHTASAAPDGRMRVSHVRGEDDSVSMLMRMHEVADLEDLRRLYFSGPLSRGGHVVERSSNSELRALFSRGLVTLNTTDGYGVIGHDTSGTALVLSFLIPTPSHRIPARTRTTLLRLAGHLTTALRLRCKSTEPAAVFDPKGGELTASVSLEPESRKNLRGAALSLDRARRQAQHTPDTALGYWKAMVEGRWTLVERFESDGRRILVAHPNPPKTQRLRALTANERKVVALVALNHPAKLVAYELGFAESTTSKLLANALHKLGLHNRLQLAELHGALHGKPRPNVAGEN